MSDPFACQALPSLIRNWKISHPSHLRRSRLRHRVQRTMPAGCWDAVTIPLTPLCFLDDYLLNSFEVADQNKANVCGLIQKPVFINNTALCVSDMCKSQYLPAFSYINEIKPVSKAPDLCPGFWKLLWQFPWSDSFTSFRNGSLPVRILFLTDHLHITALILSNLWMVGPLWT